MAIVQIEDFECPDCLEITSANADLDSQSYTCLKCGMSFILGEEQ